MDSLRLADDEILGLLVVQHVHVHEHTIVQASEWKVHHDVRGATRQDTLTEAEEEHRVADVVVVDPVVATASGGLPASTWYLYPKKLSPKSSSWIGWTNGSMPLPILSLCTKGKCE